MRGFTLLELLISVAVIGIVSVLATSGFSSFRESVQLNEVQSQILGILRDARNRTLSSEKNTQYGVHFESTKVVLFSGSYYNPSASSNEIHTLPALVRISSINFGGDVDVVFARLTGAASVFGTTTIEIINNSAKARTITIISSGIAE